MMYLMIGLNNQRRHEGHITIPAATGVLKGER